MPNGIFKNWSRVAILAGAFRQRFGYPPDAVEVSIDTWGNLRHLFTRERFQEFSRAAGLIPVSGQPEPRAHAASGAALSYFQAVGIGAPQAELPHPDRQEEEPDERRENELHRALANLRSDTADFFSPLPAYRDRVAALNRGISGSADGPFSACRPPTPFSGRVYTSVPYVIFSLNPRWGPDAQTEADEHPDPDSRWQFYFDYFDWWSDRLQCDGRSVFSLAPFYSALCRLVFGLEGLQVTGTPRWDEFRLLGKLMANIDLFPYATETTTLRKCAPVYAEYLDRSLQLARAIRPELMIFNGSPFLTTLEHLGAKRVGDPKQVCGGKLTLTRVDVSVSRAIVFNRFLTGRVVAATNSQLSDEIPGAIHDLIQG